METSGSRALWVLAVVIGTWVGNSRAWAQSPPAAPSEWQPYRDGTAVQPGIASGDLPAAVAGAADGVTRIAQIPTSPPMMMPMDGMMACPPPVFAAPPYAVEPYGVAPYAMPMFVDPNGAPPNDPAYWQWRVLPDSVIWQSYWAGVHESRMSGVAFHNAPNNTNYLDVALGGRASILRYGTDGPGRPEGAEIQIEGAATPRLNLDANWDLDAVDFRFGVPLVYGRENWQAKFSYYHLSSHMGDEYAIRENALVDRINFSRDALVLGLSYFTHPAWRWYAEAGWAFHYDESEPWEFQFGVDVAEPGPTGPMGVPFFAINGHLREEVDYGGNVVAQIGWLWRGNGTSVLRTGFHYFNGKSSQFEFFENFEEQIGAGIWYDF